MLLERARIREPSIEDDIRAALTECRKIAVVGLSPNPDRPSYDVSAYMIKQGYEIVGVRPGGIHEILGRPSFDRISEVPGPLEIVNVFRNSQHIPRLVEELIPLKPKFLWLQLGIRHPAAEAAARRTGIRVISNRCILVEHRRLRG